MRTERFLLIPIFFALLTSTAFADAKDWAGAYHSADGQLELRIRNFGPTYIQYVIVEPAHPDEMDNAYTGAVIENDGAGTKATVANDICGTVLVRSQDTITVLACSDKMVFSK